MSYPTDPISLLSEHQYINLETYRKNGQPVTTPVWFTIDDNKIFVVTRNKTGKIKRLQNNSKVRIVPSGIRGQPKGKFSIRVVILFYSRHLFSITGDFL